MIRAVGWDHPRCVGPMLAAAVAWRQRTGVEVRWDFRPLAAFNDQPLDELAPRHDLLVVDHPAIPAAVERGALVALETLLPAPFLDGLVDAAIGPSGRSYRYRGSTWALAVDAACHVSAWQPRALGAAPPATWDETVALAERMPGRVGLSLLPADAMCALLSVGAAFGCPVALGVRAEAVEPLARLAPLLHPSSWSESPPQLLARMAAGEPIAYMPLTFGYLALAGEGLRFGDAPAGPGGRRGGVLGGAGVAVSSASGAPELAASFAAWLCGAEAQRTVVLARGGQPAHRDAWARARGRAAAFFAGTLATMEHAHVRPADPLWPALHRQGGAALATALRAGQSPEAIAAHLQAQLEPLGAPT